MEVQTLKTIDEAIDLSTAISADLSAACGGGASNTPQEFFDKGMDALERLTGMVDKLYGCREELYPYEPEPPL
jgi:hypothetical protein